MSWYHRASSIPKQLTEAKPLKLSYKKILKVGNPYHDALGRFTHGDGATAPSPSPSDELRSTPGAGKNDPSLTVPPKDKPITLMFGGTFNPIHTGHVAMVEGAKKWLEGQGYKVDHVVIAPSGDALAKAKAEKKGDPSEFTPAVDRAEMIGLAIQGHSGLEASSGPASDADNYTGKLRRTQIADWGATKYPGTTVVNVTGSDEAPGHPPGFPSVYMGDKGSNHEGYFYLALPREEGGISSTKIREAMKGGSEVPKDWIHPAVEKRYRELKKIRKAASYLRILKWDPEKHPRVPGGTSTGGEFTHVEGGGATTSQPEATGSKWERNPTTRLAQTAQPEYDDDLSISAYHESRYTPITEEHVLSQLPKEVQAEYQTADKFLVKNINNGGTTKQAYYESNGGKWTNEREVVHDKILEEFLADAKAKYSPAPGEQPHLILLGGRGGSGKSFFGKEAINAYDPKKYLVCDPDTFKEMLLKHTPGMNLTMAALLHDESSDLNKLAIKKAREMGINFVIDGTMSSDPTEKYILTAKANGYKVSGYYMYKPPDQSAIGVIKRWWNDGKPTRGRLVKIDHILSQTLDCEKNFDRAKGYMDDWMIFSATNARGDKGFVKLAQKGQKGKERWAG